MSKTVPVVAAPAAPNRDAKMIWWAAQAKERGLDSAGSLQHSLGLPAYRLSQIYRAATKELHRRSKNRQRPAAGLAYSLGQRSFVCQRFFVCRSNVG